MPCMAGCYRRISVDIIAVQHSSPAVQSHVPVKQSSPTFQSHVPVENPVQRLETPSGVRGRCISVDNVPVQ